jgi:exosortase H (IPTLxxWG-CTERM-specific)
MRPADRKSRLSHSPSPAPMRRFLFLFPLCLLAGFAMLEVPAVAGWVVRFTDGLVILSGGLIHLFGGAVLVSGTTLSSPANGFGVQVENGCNAVNVTILLWSAILVYPARWIDKLKGLAAGTLVLHALNLLRIVSLYYLGQYNRSWFEFAHLYLWESLIVLDTLAIFWGWAVLVRRWGSRRNAAAE